MGLTGFTIDDLRGMPRNEVEGLVAAKLIAPELAAVVLSELTEHEQQAQQRQSDEVQKQEQKTKEDEKAADDAWLERMPLSYRQEYAELMESYDRAERTYADIKTRGEQLRDHLRETVERAYQFGVPLADGNLAFYDRKQGVFVNENNLQPLSASDAKEAAAEFKRLSPHDQNANASYVEARHAYVDADGISQSADADEVEVQHAKDELRKSNGTLSEDELRKTDKLVNAKVKGRSDRLTEAETARDDLDAMLDADTPENTGKEKTRTSFASMLDSDGAAIGDANGKTAAAFNTAATATASLPVSPKSDGPYNRPVPALAPAP